MDVPAAFPEGRTQAGNSRSARAFLAPKLSACAFDIAARFCPMCRRAG